MPVGDPRQTLGLLRPPRRLCSPNPVRYSSLDSLSRPGAFWSHRKTSRTHGSGLGRGPDAPNRRNRRTTNRGVHICPERERGNRPPRGSEPRPHRAPIVRIRSTEHRLVGLDPTSVCSAVGNDQPRGHRARCPAPGCADDRRQSSLSIERPDQFVDVGELRLQLDDEQRTPGLMPPEDVDHAALAVDREGHLRRKDPAGPRCLEPPGNLLVERRVPTVHQPIEVAGTPSGDQIHADLQGRGDGPDRLDRMEP